jgi:hypothetical protein
VNAIEAASGIKYSWWVTTGSISLFSTVTGLIEIKSLKLEFHH